MKRIAIAVAVIVAALGLVACGGGGSDESPKQQHLDELAESTPEATQQVERSLALVAIEAGDVAGARADLAKGCPDTPPDEAMEHLREIQTSLRIGNEVGGLGSKASRELIDAELREHLC
jgi:hypothetical protein